MGIWVGDVVIVIVKHVVTVHIFCWLHFVLYVDVFSFLYDITDPK